MKFGQKVFTPDGTGVFIEKESELGALSHRYKIRLDQNIKGSRGLVHDIQGGLYYYDIEVKKI